jgi:Ca-activated chloride channel family protein
VPPDLYAGEPLVVAVRLARPAGTLEVSGRRGGQVWHAALPLSGGGPETGLNVLWARRKIEGLLDGLTGSQPDEAIRGAVTRLALAHHLVSPYTSLVAIDQTPVRPAGERVKIRPVPVNLPAGWEYDRVFGGMPRTAAGTPMQLLAGLLLVILGGCLRRLARAWA